MRQPCWVDEVYITLLSQRTVEDIIAEGVRGVALRTFSLTTADGGSIGRLARGGGGGWDEAVTSDCEPLQGLSH